MEALRRLAQPSGNYEVARILDEVGDLLEIQGENVFRVRAYRGAARLIRELSEPVSERLADPERPLTELAGIGKDLAGKIATIVKTGDLPLRKQLARKVPDGVRDMLTLPGLGPKRAMILYRELGLDSKEALVRAAQVHRIRKLNGFGEKTEESILRAIEQLKETSQRFYLSEAKAYADSIVRHLNRAPGVRKLAVAGSLRRGKETVGDIDLLTCCESPSRVMDALASYEAVSQVLGRGRTKMSVRLKNGMQVDLRAVPLESFGAALVYFTGSKAHNIALRRRAQERRLKINEYGVFRGTKRIAGKAEEEIYRAVGLTWIPPELREARSEIADAEKHRLPELVTLSDIKGDLHAHTTATDGRNSIEEMALAAKARGYSYLAITDHSRRVTMANGLTVDRLRAQWRKIDKWNAQTRGIVLLKGIEIDILEDGTLDLPGDVLKDADWVIASIHYGQKQSKARITKRILSAIRSPHVSAIAHPTGRLIARREPYEVDLAELLKAAADYGCAIEANGQPSRLDLNDVFLIEAKERGISIVIDSDAHSIEELGFLELGLQQARRAGLEATQVINTKPLPDFMKALRTKVA
jgi:DNA polymerase (family 10)